jgi:hypothetical protein
MPFLLNGESSADVLRLKCCSMPRKSTCSNSLVLQLSAGPDMERDGIDRSSGHPELQRGFGSHLAGASGVVQDPREFDRRTHTSRGTPP